MISDFIDTIKRVALNAFEASKPVNLLFGKVISGEPDVKIRVNDHLTLTKEFLVMNGSVQENDNVSLIRCQGGQKYVVLGTRTQVINNNVYLGGEDVAPADGKWQYPFKSGYYVSSEFGKVRSGGKIHKGVDLVGTGSKHIYPINNGKVVAATSHYSYGNYVIVDHGGGYWSLYAHLSKIYVKNGQAVNKNTILGVEGSTGNSTGSHLHLEVRKGSNSSENRINPVTFLGG